MINFHKTKSLDVCDELSPIGCSSHKDQALRIYVILAQKQV
jgi:hypothetical protein